MGGAHDSRRWRWHLLVALGFLAALAIRFHVLLGEDPSQVALLPDRGERSVDAGSLPAGDLRFVVWLVARNARTLLHAPGSLFAAEPCHPAENALALGEPGVTLGLLAAPVWALTEDPLLSFHAAVLASVWLAAFAMYWLVRSWTGSAAAGVVAGLLFGFHPARIGEVIHPYIWDNGWLVFGLFFAERLFATGRWRHALGLAACGALQIGGSLYPLAGGAALGLPLLVWLFRQHGPRALRPGPLLLVLGVVGVASATLFAPYLELRESQVLVSRFQLFLPWSDLLPGHSLFPGWLLLLLAIAGLVLAPRAGGLDPRWALLAGWLLVTYLAAGGSAGQGALAISRGEAPGWNLPNLYAALATVVPGLEIVRAPSNLYTGAFVALCVLAGLGAAAVLERVPARAARPAAVALVLVAGLAALRPPLPGIEPSPRLVALRVAPDPELLDFYRRLAELGDDGPILEVPYHPKSPRSASSAVLLSAYHHRRTAACWGSRWPDEVELIQRLASRLPDAVAVRSLAELGFRTVIMRHPTERPTAWAQLIERRVEQRSAGTLRKLYADEAHTAWAIEAAAVADPAPASPRAGSPAVQLDVVWLVIDAAGAAHLSLYGGERQTSPRIDELARESLVFERAYAQAPMTLPSTASFLTGLYPARAVSGRRLAAPTLAEFLRGRGYATAAFSENPWVSPEFRFARGFEEFQRPQAGIPARGAQDSGRTVELALAWVDAREGSPFFLYVHFLPPHTPYAPPAPFQGMFRGPFESAASSSSPGLAVALGKRAPTPAELRELPEKLHESVTLPAADVALLRAAYHENLAYADAEVGRLVDGLRGRGLLERSIVVVSSDHGEAFGEHGEWIHGTGLHDEQIRVPLLVRLPATLGVEQARWPGVVELVDLVPTILDLLGSPVDGLDGKSWLPAVRGEGGSDEIARAWLRSEGQAAVIRGDSKLIEGERVQLFDLASDPGETRNLAALRSSTVESLRGQLDRQESPAPEAPQEIDPRTRAELEALGYTLENESD